MHSSIIVILIISIVFLKLHNDNKKVSCTTGPLDLNNILCNKTTNIVNWIYVNFEFQIPDIEMMRFNLKSLTAQKHSSQWCG